MASLTEAGMDENSEKRRMCHFNSSHSITYLMLNSEAVSEPLNSTSVGQTFSREPREPVPQVPQTLHQLAEDKKQLFQYVVARVISAATA